MLVRQIESALEELKAVHAGYKIELEQAPVGKLLCSDSRGRLRCSVGVYKDGRYACKGITRQPDLIYRLARKEYLRRALPRIEANIKTLETAAKHYEPLDPEHVVASLSAGLRRLPTECFLRPYVDAPLVDLDANETTRIARHVSWGEEPYSDGGHMREGRKLVTSRGLKVRSKAELLIAERLYAFGIPFRYEQELWLEDGSTVYPDFTFEGADYTEFYLEFCGMMDNQEYVEKWWRKVMRYKNCGIVPWKNIIYVYAQGNDMNVMYIDSMIRSRIIPWL